VPIGPATNALSQKGKSAPTQVNIGALPPPLIPVSDPPEVEVTSPVTPGSNPQEKKIRGLLKKIRAIEDLKMRHASGEKLEGTQLQKITSEDGVRKELAALGYNP
jgi:translation initiation factor 2A